MTFQNQVLTLEVELPGAPQLVVAKLHGEENMSGLFRFDLDLLSSDAEIDLEAVLYAEAKLGIKVMTRTSSGTIATATRHIGGVFEEFEQYEQGQGMAKYHAVFVPKVWQATRSHRSRIVMGKSVEGLVRAVLGKEDIKHDPSPNAPSLLDRDHDYDFKLLRHGDAPEFETQGDRQIPRPIYPPREYVVQYEESDWAFLARWLEHEGIYFYFVNDGGEEKLIFADTESSYEKPLFGSVFPYRPESAGDGADSDRFTEEEVRTFRCRQRRLPKHVSVNDYNWRVPSARLHFTKDVRENGTGMQTEYNDHFKDEKQGKALLEARKDELACRAKVFYGTGSCRSFRPGQTFTLDGHFREDYNRSFVLTRVVHDAEQMISVETSSVTGVKYENAFEAIPDDVPWRPERTTEWPSIKGVMHAKVDSAGDGKYADLDPDGRYLLRMPYDEFADVTPDGQASRWVRMAQPYAGANAGMHFPLLKGTEVLVTHIDGDPDRPVISGAVPNPETESPTTGEYNRANAIKTASGNLMHMDDSDEAPGFVYQDSLSSVVSDQRRHRKPNANRQPASSSASGNGGVMPTTPNGQAQLAGLGMVDPNAENASSSGWSGEYVDDAGNAVAEGTCGAKVGIVWAWGKFLSGEAVADISSDGKYVGDSESGLTLSDTGSAVADQKEEEVAFGGAGGAGPDSQFGNSESALAAGLPKVLKQLAKLSKRIADGADIEGPPSNNGPNPYGAQEFAHPDNENEILKEIHTFKGEAFGSRLRTWIGDDWMLQVGNKYTYADVSCDVKIGTGGLGWAEELGDTENFSFHYGDDRTFSKHYGDSSNESIVHGNDTALTRTYGTSTSTSWKFSAEAHVDFVSGAASNSSIQLGGFNSNSLFVGANADTSFHYGAHFSLDIGGAARLAINMGIDVSSEIDLRPTVEFDLYETQIALDKKKATLNQTAAALVDGDNAISRMNNTVAENQQAISATKAALNENTTALKNSIISVSQNQVAMSDQAALASQSHIAMQRNLTAALTTI